MENLEGRKINSLLSILASILDALESINESLEEHNSITNDLVESINEHFS